MKLATGEISWEQVPIEASKDKWKDEYAGQFVFILIVAGTFVPESNHSCNKALIIWRLRPPWFQWAVYASIATTGIRTMKGFGR